MTCIVALIDNEKTAWMGADAAGSNGWEMRRVAYSKVFPLKGMLVGYTSSFRMGQMLQYEMGNKLEPFAGREKGDDELEYMICHFVPAVRSIFKDGGFSKIENNEETGGYFIVALNGRLFVVQEDYSVLEHIEGFEAVGSGAPYALGALHILKDELKPEQAVRCALEAAEHFSTGVSSPFTIMCLRENGEMMAEENSDTNSEGG